MQFDITISNPFPKCDPPNESQTNSWDKIGSIHFVLKFGKFSVGILVIDHWGPSRLKPSAFASWLRAKKTSFPFEPCWTDQNHQTPCRATNTFAAVAVSMVTAVIFATVELTWESRRSTNFLTSDSCDLPTFKSGWWFQPLWKIWKSVGLIIPNIWENVPNHQPVFVGL